MVLALGWAIDTAGGPHFTDVPTGSVFYAYIETLYNHGAISGYPDHTFHPDSNVTRAQLCKIVVIAKNWPIYTLGGPHFTDVPRTHQFYNYIETAWANGVVGGYADHTFHPDENASRGQVSVVIYRAIPRPGLIP